MIHRIDTSGASSAVRSTTLSDLDYTVGELDELAFGAFNTGWTVVKSDLCIKGVRVDNTAP